MDDCKVENYAEVTIKIKIPVGTWSKECTLEQVKRQATEEAVLKINQMLKQFKSWKISGEPKIISIYNFY